MSQSTEKYRKEVALKHSVLILLKTGVYDLHLKCVYHKVFNKRTGCYDKPLGAAFNI